MVSLRAVAPLSLALPLSFLAASPSSESGKLWIESREGTLTSRSLEGLEVRSLSELGAVALRVEGCDEPDPAGALERRAKVSLVGGDRVRAAVGGGEGDSLSVELAGGVALTLDVGEIYAIEFDARAPAGLERAPSGDRLVWVRPGGFDKVDGTLEGFSAEGVVFDSVLGSRTFAWSEVAALFVEPLEEPRALAAGAVAVDLADGGRLCGELARWSAEGLSLALDGQRTLELASGAVREVTLADGSVAFLSQFEPALVREGWSEGDGVGMNWPWQRDLSVVGKPLAAGGRVWPRGLGVHAPSRLEFALDGGWKSLRGAVAIDDSVRLFAYKGSVEFSIFLDEKPEPAWRSGRVRGGEAPLALPALELGGVKRIALVVDMDERSFVADRADWLRLLLVR
jgi:hypothetical protein